MNFRCDLPVANHAEQQRNLRIAVTETVRRVDITWMMPGAFQLQFTYPNGLVYAICGFATLIDDRHCRRIQWVYSSATEADAPATGIAAFDRGVGEEDLAILESCPADFPLDPEQQAHMILHRPSLLMRQVLRRLVREHDPNAEAAAQELAAGDATSVQAAPAVGNGVGGNAMDSDTAPAVGNGVGGNAMDSDAAPAAGDTMSIDAA